MATTKTPVLAIAMDASKNVEKNFKKEEKELEKLSEKVSKKMMSEADALEKAGDIINEGLNETNAYVREILEEAGKENADAALKTFASAFSAIEENKKQITLMLSRSIKECEDEKARTQDELDECSEKFKTASEDEKKKIEQKILDLQNQIKQHEHRKQKKIDEALAKRERIVHDIRKHLEETSAAIPSQLSNDYKKATKEIDELASKLESGSLDFMKAIDVMCGKKSSNKDSDDEDDKNVPKWKKTINSIIEEDEFAGRAVKAFYMAKNAKKSGGSIAGGLVKAFKGDVHRSFQKWAYGGSGVSGVAKALVGRFIDSRLSARAEKRLKKEIDSRKSNLERLSVNLKAAENAPNKDPIDIAGRRIAYNRELKKLLLMIADSKTHGRSGLIDMDSDLMSTSDEMQTLGKKESELLQQVNKQLAKDTQQFAARRGLPSKPTEAPVKKAETLAPEEVLRLRPALEGPKQRSKASTMTIDVVAEEIKPQVKDLGSHAVGAAIGTPSAFNVLRSVGALVKGTPKGTFLPTLRGNRIRGSENSKSEVVLPMQGKVPAMVGRAIAAAAGFGKTGPKGSSTGGKMQYESSADHEMRQQELEDRHSIAQNVATIVEILQREENERKKPKEKGFFQKILDAIMGLGALFGPTLAKIARFIRGISSFLKGGKLLKSLAGLFGKSGLLGKIGKFFSGIFGKGGKIAGFFGKIGKFFGGIFGKGGAIGKFFSGIFGKGGTLGKVFGKIGSFAKSIGGLFSKAGFGKIIGMFGKLGGIIKSFGGIIGKIAWPIQAIMSGIDAFKGWNDEDLHKRAFGLKDGEKATTSQKVMASWGSMGAGFLNGLTGGAGMLAKWLGFEDLGNFLEGLHIDPAEMIKAMQNPLKTLGNFLLKITDGIPIVGDIIKGVGEFIESSPMLKGAIDWLDQHNPFIMISNAIGGIIDWFKSDTKWEDIKNGLSNIGKWFLEKLNGIGQWISEKVSSAWEWIKENNPLTLIWNGLGSIGQWISEKVSSAWEWIKENNPITLLQNGLESIGKWVSEKATAAWEWIKENNPITLLQNGFESIGKWVSEKATAVWEFVKENNPFTLISKAFDDIKKWLEEHNPFGVIEEFFEGISEKFKKLNPFDWFGGDDEKKSKPKVEKQAPPEPPAIRQAHARQGLDAYAAQGGVDWNGKPIARLAPVYDPKKTAVPAMPSIAPIAALVGGAAGSLGGSAGGIGPIAALVGGAAGNVSPRPNGAPAIDLSKIGGLSKEGAFNIEKSIMDIDKNVESIYKMMRYIKVDGVTLGDLLDKKPIIPGTTNPVVQQPGPGGYSPAAGPAAGPSMQPLGAPPQGSGQPAGPTDQLAIPQTGGRELVELSNEGDGKNPLAYLNAKGKRWQRTKNVGNIKALKGQASDGRDRVFSTYSEGILEQHNLLGRNYFAKGLDTVESILYKYAPPTENKTEEYISFVCKMAGFNRKQKLDYNNIEQMASLQRAMIAYETSHRFKMSEIKGIYAAAGKKEGATGAPQLAMPQTPGGPPAPAPSGAPSGGPAGTQPTTPPSGGMEGGPVGQPAPTIPGSGGLAGIVQGMGSFKYGMYNKGGRYGRYNKLVKGADGRWHAGSGAGFASMDCSQFASAVMANAGYGAYVNKNGDASRAEDIRQDLKNKHMPLRTDLSQVQEGDIAFTIGGKHTGGGEAGHVAVVIKDPQTGAPMIAESTGSSRSIGGGLKISPLQKWVGYYSGKKRVEIYQSPISGKAVGGPMAGGPAGPIGGALEGGNIKDAMGGVQQPGPGGIGGPAAGPQIQGSQQATLAEQAGAYYAAGGAGGLNINNGGNTNILGGADRNKTAFITTKDPMGWIILQGNCVH